MVFIIESLRFNHFFVQDKKCLREWVYIPFPLLCFIFYKLIKKIKFVELDCWLEFVYWAIKYSFLVDLFILKYSKHFIDKLATILYIKKSYIIFLRFHNFMEFFLLNREYEFNSLKDS